MRLQLMTWPQVEEHVKVSRGVVIPAGATEQHGPTGPIGTDAICAESLAWTVGERVNAVVAPTISYGMSLHHMRFPGSVTLRPTTLVYVVRDVILALAQHGFRRFFILNGHGGNTASLNTAIFEAYAEARSLIDVPGDLRCMVMEWWECEAAKRLSAELFGDRDGDHASASEVSLAWHAHPDHVCTDAIEGDAAASGPVYGPDDFRTRYFDGRMGSDPTLASVAHGSTLHEAIAADLAKRYTEFLGEE